MLRDAITRQLSNLEETYGITINIGNIRYDGSSLRTKMEVHVNNPDGAESFEQAEFDKYCLMFGLKSKDFNAEVTLSGGKYSGVKAKIYGFKPRSTKYPVLVRTSSGMPIKTSTLVLSQLKG